MTKRVKGNAVSYEEGLEHVRQFVDKNYGLSGHRSCLLMQEGDLFFIYECGVASHEPCYGYLRTYGKDSTRPDDPRPGDLPRDFPDGNPVILGVPFYNGHRMKNDLYYNWWYGPRSPYRELFLDAELMEDEHHIRGIVFKDTNIDSTLLVSFLRANRYPKQLAQEFKERMEKFPNEDPHLIASSLEFFSRDGYPRFTSSDPERWYNGNWTDLTGGTFYNRYAYNRPEVDYVFGRLSVTFGKLCTDKFKGRYSTEETMAFYKELVNVH